MRGFFDKNDVLCAGSFALYWTWIFCALLSNPFGYSSESAGFVDTWLISTLFHGGTLASLYYLARKGRLGESRPALLVLSSSLSLAGFVLLVVAPLQASFAVFFTVLGAAISGSGTAFWVMLWTRTFTDRGSDSKKQVLLFMGIIASNLINVGLSFVPQPILIIVLALIPAASIIMVLGIDDLPEAREVTPEQKETSVKLSPRFIVYCMVFTIPLGFYQTWFHSEENYIGQWRPIFLAVVLVLAALFIVDLLLHKRTGRRSIFLEKLVMPVMVAGLFILSAFGQMAFVSGGMVLFIAQQIMDIVLYSRFGIMESRKDAMPGTIWICGIVATDVGYLTGILLCYLTQRLLPDYVFVIVLSIAYLVVMIAFLNASFLQRDKASRTLVPLEPLPVEEEHKTEKAQPVKQATKNSFDNKLELSRQLVRVIDQVAASNGLTPREKELVDYLLYGKSVPAIASEVFLSAAIVRSHIAHIYQKLGVHSRDELVDYFVALVQDSNK